jgi:3-deoxy-D-manno-octulosonic-acid transferase
MGWLINVMYLTVALVSAPIWIIRMGRTGKLWTDWRARFGRTVSLPKPTDGRNRILLHAVSVGEINAIRLLVEGLAARPERPELVIATTTDTGFVHATRLWSGRHLVVRFPFDVTWAVRRFLNAVKPDAVALVELEIWPNFMRESSKRRISVGVVNGRLTERSFRRYHLIAPLIRPGFVDIKCAAVQNHSYGDRFRALGTASDRIQVTGTMKWDTATIADHVEGADELAKAMGIDRSRPLIVAGSTAAGEHELLVEAVPEGAQLLCAPRKPEWFDQAAHVLKGCARRSHGDCGSSTGRFLLDTIGELRSAYALADVVVVGRTFGDLHGSDMMEPIALGKATVVGPATADFQDTVDALLAGEGLVQVESAMLSETLRQLLDDQIRRETLAHNGREVIRQHQGATNRHVDVIMSLLTSPDCQSTNAKANPPS